MEKCLSSPLWTDSEGNEGLGLFTALEEAAFCSCCCSRGMEMDGNISFRLSICSDLRYCTPMSISKIKVEEFFIIEWMFLLWIHFWVQCSLLLQYGIQEKLVTFILALTQYLLLTLFYFPIQVKWQRAQWAVATASPCPHQPKGYVRNGLKPNAPSPQFFL